MIHLKHYTGIAARTPCRNEHRGLIGKKMGDCECVPSASTLPKAVLPEDAESNVERGEWVSHADNVCLRIVDAVLGGIASQQLQRILAKHYVP